MIIRRYLMLFGNNDFEFLEMHIKNYKWHQSSEEFEILCRYQNKEAASVMFGNVRNVDNIPLLNGRVIEYIQYNFGDNRNVECYEIHFKDISETVNVWADSIKYLY